VSFGVTFGEHVSTLTTNVAFEPIGLDFFRKKCITRFYVEIMFKKNDITDLILSRCMFYIIN
jgi:hypothetical protein